MKASEVKVGGLYLARVSGKLTTVRVEKIRKTPGNKYARAGVAYDVTNLATGRTTTFHSAAKFRGPAPAAGDKASSPRGRRDNAAAVPDLARKIISPDTPARADAGETLDEALSTMERVAEGDNSSDPTAATSVIDASTRKITRRASARDRVNPPVPNADTTTATGAAPTTAPTSGLAELLRNSRKSPSTVPDTVAGYTPTEEQRAILEVARTPGLNVLVIGAGAGTGKTSTLKMLEEVLPGKGQYTAFNRALVLESKGKFRKARCNTTHSLAFGAVGYKFSHRLDGPRVRSEVIAAILGIEPLTVQVPTPPGTLDKDGNPITEKDKVLQAGLLASMVMGATRRFCQSADREITAEHFKFTAGLDTPDPDTGRPRYDNQNRVRDYLLPFARKAWADLSDPNGRLPYSPDCYVKVWQLGLGPLAPVIPCDYLLLDEAQDTAPVFLDVVSRQRALLIFVGDDCQQIYTWRGAVNAMASFPDAPRRLLSQSFRFGQAVADVANSILRELDEPTDLVMKGLVSIPSRVIGPNREGEPSGVPCRAVLCRTNAAAIATVLQAQKDGKRVHLIANTGEVIAFVKAARDLQANRPVIHPDLGCFSSWAEVQEYVKTEEGEDLKLMVKLVDEFTCEAILTALEHMPREQDADLVVCTAHKSKGREWPSVKLAGDFPPRNRMDDEAVRLLYVAATRAQYVLDVSECPPFLPGKDRDTGEEVPPIRVTFTQTMPTQEQLDAYLSAKAVEKAEEKAAAPVPTQVGQGAPTLADQPAPTNGSGATGGATGAFTWTRWDERWLLRGPHGVAEGTSVTVTKKDGRSSTERVGKVAKKLSDVTIYELKR